MRALLALLRHARTVRAAQVVSALLLGWAALAKLSNIEAFAQQVHNFRILPLFAENLIAIVLPWIELLAALALLLGIRARAGAVVTVTLLSVFTLGVIAAVARGLDFECGCFGTADGSRVGLGKILQNLAMLLVAVVASLEPRRTPAPADRRMPARDARELSPS